MVSIVAVIEVQQPIGYQAVLLQVIITTTTAIHVVATIRYSSRGRGGGGGGGRGNR